MSVDWIGRVLGGRYRLERLLGSGAETLVYEAHDTQLERPVAVKILRAEAALDPQIAAAFAEEARLTAGLHHPHLARVYDAGVQDGRPYIVLERVPGAPLDPAQRLTVGQTVDIGIQVAGALAFLHDHGLLHCDIKPANLLLDAAGQVKLVDVGAPGDGQPSAYPATGTVGGDVTMPLPVLAASPGTVPYLAPERLAGAPPHPAGDLYSLGAVLYALLTGRPPYLGATPAALRAAQAAGPPPALQRLNPAVPVALAAVVSRALAPDPMARFASTWDMSAALEKVREEGRLVTGAFVPGNVPPDASAPFTPPPEGPPGGSRVRIPPWVLSIGVIVLLAGLLALGALGLRAASNTLGVPVVASATALGTPVAGTEAAGVPSFPPSTVPSTPTTTPAPATTTRVSNGVGGPVPATQTPLPPTPAPAPATPTSTPTRPPAPRSTATPLRGPLRPAPNLVGLSVPTAALTARRFSFQLHAVAGSYSRTVPRNRVLAQQPSAGTLLPPGAPIRVTFSRGPPP